MTIVTIYNRQIAVCMHYVLKINTPNKRHLAIKVDQVICSLCVRELFIVLLYWNFHCV